MNIRRILSRGFLRVCVLAVGLWAGKADAQFKNEHSSVGVRFGGMVSQTEFSGSARGYLARGVYRQSFSDRLRSELGLGFGELEGSGFRSRIAPLELRLLISLGFFRVWSPYLYAGAGGMYFETENPSVGGLPSSVSGRSAVIPLGIGAQFMMDDIVALDISAGYNQTFSDKVTPALNGGNASYWSLAIGVSIVGERDLDPDRDGLKTSEERRISTDPLNPDTDGDGLTDGEEVRVYKTNPLLADTDGDGLRDGDEVKVYSTDPLVGDTDGDGLSDGDEVLKHKTSPLRVDTDGDGLSDGDEVLRYATNPLEADTDRGGVPDGIEVRRGSNPLNPEDDFPKPAKQTLTVEVGKAIILEGVTFKFGSAEILPESEPILDRAFETMRENPEIIVEIHGHTDNIGKPSYNLQLSLSRANSVKAYLVKRGIAADRITARGFAAVRPIASNSTDEGRARNRRIEFLRVR